MKTNQSNAIGHGWVMSLLIIACMPSCTDAQSTSLDVPNEIETDLDEDDAADTAVIDTPDLDAELSEDDTRADGPLDMASSPPPGMTEITLHDGTIHLGELVATYDHSVWWEASDEVTYALFDAASFAPWPDDHSMRFISSNDAASIVTAPGVVQGVDYQTWARQQAIVVARPPMDGVSYVITGNDSYHLEENGFGDFAWDLVKTDDLGARFTNLGAANEDYLIWGEPVYMPAEGTIIEVIRSSPDGTPGVDPGPAAVENLVGLTLGGQYYLYLLHFQQNSIPSPDDATCEPDMPGVPCIVPGAVLPAGTYLGDVGNSGTSLEPHLHVTVLWFDDDAEPPRSWSVPSEFANLYAAPSPVGGQAEHHDYLVPSSGKWIGEMSF